MPAHVLLVTQAPIYRHERIEMLFSGAQQLSILQSFPFPVTDRLNDEIFRERTSPSFFLGRFRR